MLPVSFELSMLFIKLNCVSRFLQVFHGFVKEFNDSGACVSRALPLLRRPVSSSGTLGLGALCRPVSSCGALFCPVAPDFVPCRHVAEICGPYVYHPQTFRLAGQQDDSIAGWRAGWLDGGWWASQL